jgi:phosphoglycerate dehydrogenase-like enzyme
VTGPEGDDGGAQKDALGATSGGRQENALVSGHIAGLFARYDDAVVDLFRANLDHYLAGEPLINTLDREGGY